MALSCGSVLLQASSAAQQEPGKLAVVPRPTHCSNGVFSLCEAARAGDEKLVSKTLKEGYPVNMRNEMGMTPLHLAVQGGHAKVVRLLLKEGADVLAKNREGQTPAQLTKNAALSKLLLAAHAKRERELQLFESVKQGDATKLRAALAGNVGPNIYSEDGADTLLHTAAEARNNKALELLLKAGAKTELQRKDGKTALHVAAGAGNVQAVQLLLEAGADPFAKAGNGASALHEAVWYNQADAFRALLPVYKKVNFSPEGSASPVYMVIGRGNVNMLKELLSAGLRVNDPCFARNPLLIAAVQAKQTEMVRVLLEAGADKNTKDEQGRTAKDYATDEILDLLK